MMKTFKQLDEIFKPKVISAIRNHTQIDADLSEFGRWVLQSNRLQLLAGKQETYNFVKVGRGAFGSVFVNPNYPWAVKLYTASSPNHGYPLWVRYCNHFKGNPYLPRFKGLPVRVTNHNSGYYHHHLYVIRVEKLLPINMTEWLMFMDDIDKAFRLYKGDPDLVNITKFIYKVTGMAHDLTNDNIMKRPNGQMVIIDPLVG